MKGVEDYTCLPIGAVRKIKGQDRQIVECPHCNRPGLIGRPYLVGEKMIQTVTHKEIPSGITIYLVSCTIKIWQGESEIRVGNSGYT